MKNSKILITGGAGFIGSTLADALISHNEIVVVDDLSMGNVENLPKSAKVHFFNRSIADSLFMEKLLTSWNFDYIFLLAAVASVADTIERPYETHIINQDANISILEMIRKNKLQPKSVLFASSAAVYGDDLSLPKKENSRIEPLSPYAIDKFATERFVINYGKLYNIPTVASRFFNVYGPKQNPNSPYSGVLSLISEAAKKNRKFKIFGDGKQTRDFVYVNDVVNALILLSTNKKALHDVYNVATSTQTELIQVIKIFEKISERKIQIEYGPERIGDIKYSYASIDKLKKLGYKPKYKIEDGLCKYWQNII